MSIRNLAIALLSIAVLGTLYVLIKPQTVETEVTAAHGPPASTPASVGLTPEFCIEHKLFTYAWSGRNERFEIDSREFKQVKEKLLFQLTNAGNPFIYVEDANYDNRGELLLKHDHQGMDLRADYAREVMKSLVRVWKRPVNLLTLVEGKQVMIRFDGREHSTRHMRP